MQQWRRAKKLILFQTFSHSQNAWQHSIILYFSLEIIKKNWQYTFFFFEIRKTYGATQNGFFRFNLSAYRGPDAFDTEFGLGKKLCSGSNLYI